MKHILKLMVLVLAITMLVPVSVNAKTKRPKTAKLKTYTWSIDEDGDAKVILNFNRKKNLGYRIYWKTGTQEFNKNQYIDLKPGSDNKIIYATRNVFPSQSGGTFCVKIKSYKKSGSKVLLSKSYSKSCSKYINFDTDSESDLNPDTDKPANNNKHIHNWQPVNKREWEYETKILEKGHYEEGPYLAEVLDPFIFGEATFGVGACASNEYFDVINKIKTNTLPVMSDGRNLMEKGAMFENVSIKPGYPFPDVLFLPREIDGEITPVESELEWKQYPDTEAYAKYWYLDGWITDNLHAHVKEKWNGEYYFNPNNTGTLMGRGPDMDCALTCSDEQIIEISKMSREEAMKIIDASRISYSKNLGSYGWFIDAEDIYKSVSKDIVDNGFIRPVYDRDTEDRLVDEAMYRYQRMGKDWITEDAARELVIYLEPYEYSEDKGTTWKRCYTYKGMSYRIMNEYLWDYFRPGVEHDYGMNLLIPRNGKHFCPDKTEKVLIKSQYECECGDSMVNDHGEKTCYHMTDCGTIETYKIK